MQEIEKNRAIAILQILNEKDRMRMLDQYLFLGQLLGIAEFIQDQDLKSDIRDAQALLEQYL
ncbi:MULTISPECIES: hypothetical protein [Vibrio]|uniref:hypothetical protein n=1 Tax=Vibrio TaxID=662 RepID=UPI00078B4AE9|nr:MULTISPECIES: hypothetical protein [Vibrio]BAU70821.1 hypothetical protein [Vibrio sp. 04Ya108]BBM67610.1 hypothetical protein VA249_42560 [Vibrio alfacsensis]BCN27093.1 hypothetical protein VYA_42850 [Vibrio alfacsensis]